jgi:hypothetical protein
MKKFAACTTALLFATILFAQSTVVSFKMKTGLWQETMVTTTTGTMALPPELAAKMTPEQLAKLQAAVTNGGAPRTITYKKCVTKDDLTKDPFSDPKEKCTWEKLTSDGSKGEAKGTCSLNDMGKMDINFKWELPGSDTLKGTGTMAVTMNGHTMTSNATLTGKWLGATCPADAE